MVQKSIKFVGVIVVTKPLHPKKKKRAVLTMLIYYNITSFASGKHLWFLALLGTRVFSQPVRYSALCTSPQAITAAMRGADYLVGTLTSEHGVSFFYIPSYNFFGGAI